MYAIAKVLTSNKTWDNKMKTIDMLLKDDLGKKVREVVTGGSTPDTECKKARERAEKIGHTSAPVINYKHNTERQNVGNTEPAVKINTHARVKNAQGKQVRAEFEATKRGWCGKCWLCGLDVYFYSNPDFVTSCGECEHVGAIIASFLTGMLTSADLDTMAYNYGTSHVHCNQKKWHIISMKFDNNKLWQYDENGANTIASKIVDSDNIHETEYDPIFKENFLSQKKDNKEVFKAKIKKNIEGVTLEWCRQANASFGGLDKKIILKGYKLSALVEKISIELMKRTKKYRDFMSEGGTRKVSGDGDDDDLMNIVDDGDDKKEDSIIRVVSESEGDNSESETELKKHLYELQNELNDIDEEDLAMFKNNMELALGKIPRLQDLNIALKEFFEKLPRYLSSYE